MPTSQSVRMVPVRLLMAAAFSVVWSGSVRVAQAQRSAGDESVRTQLVDRAQKAHDAGAHTEALEMAVRAGEIRQTPLLRLFIAEEQEEVKQLAEAFQNAQQCAREAKLDADTKLRDKVIERCNSLESRLKPKVSWVVVDAPKAPAGMTVNVSGRQLNHASIGWPYVITPGKVTVEATAPGHTPYRLEIEVPEAQQVRVTISLAPEAPAGGCPPNLYRDGSGQCIASGRSAGDHDTDLGPSETKATSRWRLKTPAIAVAAVGGAVLITSGAIWLVSNGRFNDLQTRCASSCTVQDRRAKIDDIKALDGWALGLALGGVALVGTASVLQWVLPTSAGSEHAQVFIDPVTRTALLGGRF